MARARVGGWEVARRDPAEKRPLKRLQEQRRIARRRWREAAKARRAAVMADDEFRAANEASRDEHERWFCAQLL